MEARHFLLLLLFMPLSVAGDLLSSHNQCAANTRNPLTHPPTYDTCPMRILPDPFRSPDFVTMRIILSGVLLVIVGVIAVAIYDDLTSPVRDMRAISRILRRDRLNHQSFMKTYRKWRINTVSENRNRELKRITKQKNRWPRQQENIGKLLLSLALIANKKLGVDERKKVPCKVTDLLTRKLMSHGRRSRFKPLFSTRRVISNEIFRLLRSEEILELRIWLIDVARRLEMSRYHNWKCREFYTDLFRAGMDILRQSLSARERYCALSLISEQGWFPVDVADEWPEFARICCKLIENFRESGVQLTQQPRRIRCYYERDRLWHDAEVFTIYDALWTGFESMDGSVMSKICRNDAVMRVAFDAIPIQERIESKFCNKDACTFLTFLLSSTSLEDRKYLLERYPEELRTAFRQLNGFCLKCILDRDEFAEIIANDMDCIRNILNMMNNPRGANRDECFKTPVRLLQYGLDKSSSELQRLLGYGLLFSARYFAKIEAARDTAESNTFRAVLAAQPQFRQQFKSMTEGYTTSHTAQLGQSIAQRPSKPGVWYIIKQEDVEMI